MKQVKRKLYAALFVLELIAALLAAPGSIARAVSLYDGVVTLTGQAKLEQNSSHGSGRIDISRSWYSVFANCNNWTSSRDSYGVSCEEANYAFSAALAKGSGWAVIQQTAKLNFNIGSVSVYAGDKFVTITWNPETDAGASFRNGAYGNKELRLTGSSYSYGFNIILNNDPINPIPVVSNGERASSPYGTNYTIIGTSEEFPYYSTDIFFANVPVFYPDGYKGRLVPGEAPSAKYVAMGDSFSSGEGVPPFQAGTDTDLNKCHRSLDAYPRLLNADSELDLSFMSFVACSGATVQNILYGGQGQGAWGEAPQLDALSSNTKIVTLTIGGNDVGFKDFATACTVGSCDFSTIAYQNVHRRIIDYLPIVLNDVYAAIDDVTSPATAIYVVGYPQIAPRRMPTGPSSSCYPLNGGLDNPDPEVNDGATVYAVVAELNSVISNAVANMSSTKFHFIDPNLAGSPFVGHDWCQQNRYFVQIGIPMIPPGNVEYSFHPNRNGHEAYASLIRRIISR